MSIGTSGIAAIHDTAGTAPMPICRVVVHDTVLGQSPMIFGLMREKVVKFQ
jgi:hypothetical protein